MKQIRTLRFIKSLSPDYCSKLLKDYISENELSPVILEDPILLQQCRTRGYMTIPIGGELRNVICGSSELHEGDELTDIVPCPFCGKAFCKRHLEEHLDATVQTSPKDREIQVKPNIADIPGEGAYLTMPNADLRTEMSGWSNQELNRAYQAIDLLIKKMKGVSD